MRAQLRGISPVIATVIILAVTIAIAVAVIGWITGLFGATTGGTEQLQIMPDSYINATSGAVYLHLFNKGSDVSIYKVIAGDCEIGANIAGSIYNLTIGGTPPYVLNTTNSRTWAGDVVIPAGANAWLVVNNTNCGGFVAGTSYTVKVYTKNGNVFSAVLVAISG